MKEPVHILLADDDKDDRFFFEKALKEIPLPCTFSTVEDGEKLLHLLTSDNTELPDVIFLDLNMPRKNGGECLDEIKSNKKLEHIPIVIYSTSLHEEVADLLYQKGAHYYLQKLNFNELPEAIHKVLTQLMKDPQKPPRSRFLVTSMVI